MALLERSIDWRDNSFPMIGEIVPWNFMLDKLKAMIECEYGSQETAVQLQSGRMGV